MAALYSDAVIYGSDAVDPALAQFCKELSLPSLEFDPQALANGTYVDEYNNFYNQL